MGSFCQQKIVFLNSEGNCRFVYTYHHHSSLSIFVLFCYLKKIDLERERNEERKYEERKRDSRLRDEERKMLEKRKRDEERERNAERNRDAR